jgi:hypothetical protein
MLVAHSKENSRMGSEHLTSEVPKPEKTGSHLVTWTPPIALWQLYLLFVFTGGIYVFFWTVRVASDIRRHLDSSVRPWLYALALAIPLVGLLVVYRQASQIQMLSKNGGLTQRPQPKVIVLLTLAVLFVWSAFDRSIGNSNDWYAQYLSLIPGLLIAPIPWLLMQQQLNRFKVSKLSGSETHWKSTPFKLTRLQYAALLPGILFIGLGVYDTYNNVWRYSGELLAKNETISSDQELYYLTVPNDGWKRIARGTISKESDLELFSTSIGASAIVYTRCGTNLQMDLVVQNRRDLLQNDWDEFGYYEERQLLREIYIPISYARYSGTMSGQSALWWAATFITDNAAVEVVAGGMGQGDTGQIERLIRSLRPGAAGKPCSKR